MMDSVAPQTSASSMNPLSVHISQQNQQLAKLFPFANNNNFKPDSKEQSHGLERCASATSLNVPNIGGGRRDQAHSRNGYGHQSQRSHRKKHHQSATKSRSCIINPNPPAFNAANFYGAGPSPGLSHSAISKLPKHLPHPQHLAGCNLRLMTSHDRMRKQQAMSIVPGAALSVPPPSSMSMPPATSMSIAPISSMNMPPASSSAMANVPMPMVVPPPSVPPRNLMPPNGHCNGNMSGLHVHQQHLHNLLSPNNPNNYSNPHNNNLCAISPGSQTNASSSSRSPSPFNDSDVHVKVGPYVYKASASQLIMPEPESALAALVRKATDEARQSMTGSEFMDFLDIELHTKHPSHGDLFQYVLNYLRRGSGAVMPSSEFALDSLLDEAQHLQMHGLAALVWCLRQRLSLRVLSVICVGVEVVLNPGCVRLFLPSFAALLLAEEHHVQAGRFPPVLGYRLCDRTTYGSSSTWSAMDVVCPTCQAYNWCPLRYGLDSLHLGDAARQDQLTQQLTQLKGVVVSVQASGRGCALVQWSGACSSVASGQCLPPVHTPMRALLPANHTIYIDPSLHNLEYQ